MLSHRFSMAAKGDGRVIVAGTCLESLRHRNSTHVMRLLEANEEAMLKPLSHSKHQRNSLMKIVLTLTILSAGLLLAAGNPETDASKKIRELQKEQIATLQQAADLLERVPRETSAIGGG